ncbi:sugar transferase [Candidatus Uhrbacteria bacterium]|nr:sugar transferase [Candidatus Uhrbacteria bacterium]
MKRLFDIIFSTIGLVALSPLLLSVALAIKLSDSGPIFYRGVRVGKGGKPFRMFKFRSMVVNADTIGGPSTSGDDKRLTRIGIFLRKGKLDELPQLIDVLRGTMSFVGPRPEVPHYINLLTQEEKNSILSVRPGITDYASLWNFNEAEILRGSADPEKTYQEKIWPEKKRLQMKYIKEQSFRTDIAILLQTIKRLIT